MILSAIIRAFKAVIDAIAKVVAWLLLAFGLWVPLLYSLIFLLVVVLFLDVPLANTGTVYFIGLFISFIGALWFSMARSAHKSKQRKRKKSVGYNVSEVKKKDKDNVEKNEEPPVISPEDAEPASQEQAQPQYAPQPQQYTQPQYVPQPQQYTQPQYASQPQQYTQPQYAPQPQQYTQPQYAPQPQQYTQPQFEPYNRPASQYNNEPQPYERQSYNEPQSYGRNSYEPQSYGRQDEYNEQKNYDTQQPYRRNDEASDSYGNKFNERSYNRQSYDRRSQFESESRLSDEQPRIFRLREDPDMLVYEYSDRLDYYKRTAQGNVFVKRKFKY